MPDGWPAVCGVKLADVPVSSLVSEFPSLGVAGAESAAPSSSLSSCVNSSSSSPYNKIILFQFPDSSEKWKIIAEDYNRKWQFPHCLGAVDGKHIRIVPPPNSGSYYFNYKGTHSIVLIGIANANYEFVYVDVGANGRISDGGVITNTKFFAKLTHGSLNIPQPNEDDTDTVLPYVFVGDEAFSLRPDFMKPYSRKKLTKPTRIFNYRLSRARRVIENTFGIMASRFRVLYTAINLEVENIETIVLACCVLHNFLRRQCSDTYMSPDVVDTENTQDGSVVVGARCDPDFIHDLQQGRRGLLMKRGKEVREKFTEYFNNEGSVPWQDQAIA